MKIVQLITRPQRRGAEIFAMQLSEHLVLMGHQVIVISIFEGTGGLCFSGEWIKLDWKKSGNLNLAPYRKFSKIIDKLAPDLVQANASETLRFGAFGKLLGRGDFKLVYRNANQISHFINSGLKRIWNQFLIKQIDGVASVSGISKADFLHVFSYSKSIGVLPIGIDPKELDLKSKAEKIKDLPSSYILNLGGLVPEKNQESLLRIFAKLNAKDFLDLKLVLVGEGTEKERLLALCQSLKIDDKVFFLPNQENPFPILAGAKALALSPQAEGLPAVILEAMCLKVPVISYGVGGIPEVLTTTTGFCIPPNEEPLFLKELQSLLSSPSNQIDSITESAHDLVLSHYSLSKISKKFEAFYFSLTKP